MGGFSAVLGNPPFLGGQKLTGHLVYDFEISLSKPLRMAQKEVQTFVPISFSYAMIQLNKMDLQD